VNLSSRDTSKPTTAWVITFNRGLLDAFTGWEALFFNRHLSELQALLLNYY